MVRMGVVIAALGLASACVVQQDPQPQPAYGQPQGGGPPGATPAPAPRAIQFNGRVATAQDLQIIALIEQALGRAIPDGAYWYDRTCGAAGLWGGPTIGY